jgi:hypothetical protein
VKIQSYAQPMIAGTELRGNFPWQKDRPHGGEWFFFGNIQTNHEEIGQRKEQR